VGIFSLIIYLIVEDSKSYIVPGRQCCFTWQLFLLESSSCWTFNILKSNVPLRFSVLILGHPISKHTSKVICLLRERTFNKILVGSERNNTTDPIAGDCGRSNIRSRRLTKRGCKSNICTLEHHFFKEIWTHHRLYLGIQDTHTHIYIYMSRSLVSGLRYNSQRQQ
jgi:hypothetical protein